MNYIISSLPYLIKGHNLQIFFKCYYFTVDYGSWFDYTLDWEKVMEDNPEYPIHTLHFENMKQVKTLIWLHLLISQMFDIYGHQRLCYVFDSTFNNISITSMGGHHRFCFDGWVGVETGNHWQTFSLNCIQYTSPCVWIKHTTLGVMGWSFDIFTPFLSFLQ
jgi:hypothetical protein